MLKKIINLLTKEEIELASMYWKNNKYNMKSCTQSPNSLATYSNPLSEFMLLSKKPIIQEAVGEELLPTYSFSRMYFKEGELLKHSDRPSCEVSVTLNIYADKEWKIYMKRKDSDKPAIGIVTNPGEGVVYEGMKYDHWREKYEGQECMQVFLHYVRSKGKYKDYYKDQRLYFGQNEK